MNMITYNLEQAIAIKRSAGDSEPMTHNHIQSDGR
jgi:hypothetical protein